MLSTMLCVLSLGAVQVPAEPPKPSLAPPAVVQPAVIHPAVVQQVPGPVAGQWEVRLRTVDAEGKRIPDCAVYFLQADAPLLRPLAGPKPLVLRSNERGQLFAKLPAGHAWRAFAWQSRPGGPIASELVELCNWTEVRDLVLRKPHLRTIDLVGLPAWRRALPQGLRIVVDVKGLYRAHVSLPDAGDEKVYLPPMPDSDLFSIALEHEKFGTVERLLLRVGGYLDPRFVFSQDDDHLVVGLGQPVKVSGKVIGVINEPIRGARIRLLLHEAAQAIPSQSVRTDARGRYELWFPWRSVVGRIPAPALLISAPGQLLHRDSLQDLCQWITTKTEDKIDPRNLEGLDMAESRVIRLDRAFDLEWTMVGARPADRFFINMPLPIKRRRRGRGLTYLLPIRVDDRGRLEMPADRLVKNVRGNVREKARFFGHARGFELYLLRDGLCELMANVPPDPPLEQVRQFDLASRRSVLLEVTAKGRPVRDARFQVIRDLGRHPMNSAARAVGETGKFRIEVGEGNYWVFVESRTKGQAYLRIGKDSKRPAQIELLPFRLLKVLTEHPAPEIAILPLHLSMATNFESKVPYIVQDMLRANESQRPPRFLEGVPESFVVQVSPFAKTLRIDVQEPRDELGQFRPKQGKAHLGVQALEDGPVELQWR